MFFSLDFSNTFFAIISNTRCGVAKPTSGTYVAIITFFWFDFFEKKTIYEKDYY